MFKFHSALYQGLLAAALTANLPSICVADTLPTPSYFGLDTMAPDHAWGIRIEQRSNRYDARYDEQGHLTDLGDAFNHLALNASIFPALSLLGAGASLGTTRFDSKTQNQISTFTLGYGLTSDITLGAIIPYATSKTNVNFEVDGGNVGFNPAFDASQPVSAGNFPFAPAGGGIPSMGTAGVQQILTQPAYGYQYKAIQGNRTEGISDPTLGVLWRAFKTPKQSLILGLGVRLGLAKKDDPDDLLDVPLGDGSTDVRSRLEYFRDLEGNFDVHVLVDYNWQTADHVTMRVPDPGQLLALANTKQRLHRDLGDYYETDLELGYRWSNWRFAGTWHRYEKKADEYQSSLATDTTSLETNTDTLADQYRISATWSGISAWQQGKLPLPFIIKLEMQDTVAGRNFVDVSDIYLQFITLFK
jgi:hypothetical protein